MKTSLLLLLTTMLAVTAAQAQVGDLIWEEDFVNLDNWIILTGNGTWGWGNVYGSASYWRSIYDSRQTGTEEADWTGDGMDGLPHPGPAPSADAQPIGPGNLAVWNQPKMYGPWALFPTWREVTTQ